MLDEKVVERYLKKIHKKKPEPKPKKLKPIIVSKRCHSFFYSECENKHIECHRCDQFY